jgi:creatinine amidohydrolase/Fe(II)-dependent formamide hydrolase-like protein
MAPNERFISDLASPEIGRRQRATSILCLPLGATEQHGLHLPLDTDVRVAEGLTRRIVARWGDEFDLWQLPVVPVGLSREHDWAPGTRSMSIEAYVAMLRDMAREIVRALPARNLAIVNGHGGNRGVLENLLHEFHGDFGLNGCVIHPFDLARVENSGQTPDVHGGKSETSMMLVLAPDEVRTGAIAPPPRPPDAESIHALIFDRGTTWPWRTDDPRLAHDGIIGDPSGASVEWGTQLVERIVEGARGVFVRLLENQTLGRR